MGREGFFLFVMRVVLGAVFIYSGWEKLIAPASNFIAVIEGFQFLPQALVPALAYTLPWLELVFGTFLLLGFLTHLSAGVLAFFLLVFMTVLMRALILRLPLSNCGCFGSGISLTPWQAVILDVGLLIVAVLLIWRKTYFFSFDAKLRQ